MNKDKLERIFRSVGCVPVDRENIHGREVFFADGYSDAPHVNYVRRGALSPGQFPKGCFVTWWMLVRGENKMEICAPLFCESDHDVDKSHNPLVRQKMRINAAKAAAEKYIKSH